jgi:ABC-2 type transport system ATP-binding protein
VVEAAAWISCNADLEIDGDRWRGQLRGEPQEFLATLRLMEAELIEIRQGRMSLEDYFMQQMSLRGINSST